MYICIYVYLSLSLFSLSLSLSLSIMMYVRRHRMRALTKPDALLVVAACRSHAPNPKTLAVPRTPLGR